MLHNLTTEQAAKLARGWVWCAGQQGIGYVELSDGKRLYTLWRVVEVLGGRPFVWSFDDDCIKLLRDATPTINDPVTSDGLLRTARSMHNDQRIHAQPALDFDDFTKIIRWDVHGVRRCAGKTESEALLAACLAAPEATNG